MKLFKGIAALVAAAGAVAFADLPAHGATFYLLGGTAAVPASLALLLGALAGLRLLSRRRRADEA